MIADFVRRTLESLRVAVQGRLRWQYGSSAPYWEERTRRLGRRAVFNRRHSPATTDKATADLRNLLVPLLRQSMIGNERQLLDFGCGFGRFTDDFAGATGTTAIGVDPVESLVDMAETTSRAEFKLMQAGHIPLPDRSVDIITIIQVLCNITRDRELKATASELRRVLAPGGLIFLVENTTAGQKQTRHGRARSESDYAAVFSFTNMTAVGTYRDLGETFSILAGRVGGARIE